MCRIYNISLLALKLGIFKKTFNLIVLDKYKFDNIIVYLVHNRAALRYSFLTILCNSFLNKKKS